MGQISSTQELSCKKNRVENQEKQLKVFQTGHQTRPAEVTGHDPSVLVKVNSLIYSYRIYDVHIETQKTSFISGYVPFLRLYHSFFS